ncbi:MAG: SH3 domain-containing protein [Lachnospiraceae bacterium]|nr:SH3 domain-containing protein [Lachnospiraceae bacterium]
MKNTKDLMTRVSVVVIVAGTAVLIWLRCADGSQPGNDAVSTGGSGGVSRQASEIPAYLRTTAGAAQILDADIREVIRDTVPGATAGAADILDADIDTADGAAGGMRAPDVEEDESEYANLAIAKVDNYVNVRSGPNTDSDVVGKMYDGSVAQILSTTGENSEWFQVVSGTVEGYIKAEYFIYGDDAVSVIDDYVTRYVVVQADRLNVREEPDIASGRVGYIDNGERVKLIEWGDEWSRVDYAEAHTGYVASEYVTVAEEFIYAKSIEEEQAELAALLELQARTQATEEAAPERTVISTPPPQTNFASVSELRGAVVDYAMQYLGNRYVHGGQSLATGTDCSGFTCYVYKEFGYSLSRTPQGQYTSAGRSIDMSQIQPGDVICYSSNGSSCTHVGLYIGNGQIIHAANSRKGVIISNYDYDGVILGVRSIVD